MKNLMLISHPYYLGGKYLEHCEDALKKFLGPFSEREIVAFVPYADTKNNQNELTERARVAFREMGYILKSIHEVKNPNELLSDKNTKAVFVGEGNTSLLNYSLHENPIKEIIKNRVEDDELKYIAIGAGAVMACPTTKTASDFTIMEVPNLKGFNFIDFQIVQNFVPDTTIPKHNGEKREVQIKEFHYENDEDVVGLRKGSWIIVENRKCVLGGHDEAYIFHKKRKCTSLWSPGELFDEEDI